MSYYEPEDPIECIACNGEGELDGDECMVCEGSGYMSRQEKRDYIADARADMEEDR